MTKFNKVIAGFALSISISHRLVPSSIAFVCLCKALLTACIQWPEAQGENEYAVSYAKAQVDHCHFSNLIPLLM